MTKVYDTATDLITFARSSSATYLDSDGVIKTAATDAPRIEYAEDGTLKGLLIEEQRTNLLHNTDNPPTQVANLTAGSHTLSFVGGPSTQTISDSITANAVDVFVYDTKRDSDGGAWRTGSLAQASSWYNETLNTSTRGSRKEFPEVAVIVAEASKLTIYDGDDPSLPMWMVFTTGGGKPIYSTPSCTAAVNGTIVVGQNGGSGGVTELRFVEDTAFFYINNNTIYNKHQILDRNNSFGVINAGQGLNIINRTANDVAMTVLPDAPTDPATGIAVPTIAVATAGGLSVINNDGTVYDSSFTGGLSDVGFWADGTVVYGRGGFTAQALRAEPSAYQTADGFGTYILHGSLSLPTYFPYQSGLLYLPFGDNEVAGGNPSGATSTYSIPCLGRYVISSTLPQSMGCVTTSTYTTGWMNGDIKLAALANSATADRSVNNNPLTQYGTITATPVATGADVVAYSGFSSSNYLEQPYNSDLDFGTGDFCVMGWVKFTGTPNMGFLHRESVFNGGSGFGLYPTSGQIAAQVGGTAVLTDGKRYDDGTWRHLVLLRSSGQAYLFVNGSQVWTSQKPGSVTDPNATLRLGARHDGNALTTGSLALFRISATAPTADQIAKIYEDEKLLFQPNAKATLDGTSDAVTALAHDPETNLLHVGTNQSRSVFYGLRRINQTGNAVTTAISAVDGLISEQ